MRQVRTLREVLVCLLVTGAITAFAAPAASSRASAVELSLNRTEVSTRLGKSFGFDSTIRNNGRTPLSGLVAHLNIVALTKGVYVDPEDWSDQRTRYLARLDPGQAVKVGWKVKAVNSGSFAVYVALVPTPATAAPGLAVSPGLEVRVTERRTLNSDGVLPLALGVPALLGLATLGVRARRRRA
jgi:hypothetical protein